MLNQKQEKTNNTSFLDSPLDVLLEVLQYLEPVDILYLARTTKALRTFLLDRQRAHQVWKTAFGNIPGVPPCPDHLSEPAYTHLTFDPICHGCSGRCETVLWELRMRSCVNCFREMTVPCDKLDKRQDVHSAILPRSKTQHRLYESDTSVVNAFGFPTPVYRPSDRETVLEHTRLSESGKLDVSKEKEFWRPIIEHASLCQKWELQRLTDEAHRLKTLREERVNAIKKNLKELGWIDDIYYSEPFLELPGVSESRPLTASEWSELSPKLIASLPEVRFTQIEKNFSERFYHFGDVLDGFNSRHEPKARPRPVDLFLHPDIRRILESDIKTKIKKSTLEKSLAKVLPELTRQWSKEATEELAMFAKKQLGDIDPAYAVFWCTHCKGYIGFDKALSHEHLYATKPTTGRRAPARWSESRLYEEVGKVAFCSRHRRLSILRVDKNASKRMASLASLPGGKVYLLSRG